MTDNTLQIGPGQMDGILNGFDAWIFKQVIEVCNKDGDLLFTVPNFWTADQINRTIVIYQRAFAEGKRCGEEKVRGEIRTALGIKLTQ